MLRYLKSLDRHFARALTGVVFVSLSVTVIVTLLQVLFRYVLRAPLAWSQEVVVLSFAYAVLLGAALAVRNRDHLQVDVLENAPALVRKASTATEFVIVLLFIIVFIYFGVELVTANLRSGQVMAVLPIQRAYAYLAVPVSGLIMLYYHLQQVARWFG